MVLLFKKGDPQLLVNWRPLSLINSDAKLFTKLIANRMNKVLPKLINPYQTGFLPHRLISDNGWLNQLLLSHLRVIAPDLPQVAVLLDQEKAYDRVHPEYLRRVLLRFGFPAGLVSCLSSLFFGTQISVSVNGWLGAPVPQLRGLRQGDPLSLPCCSTWHLSLCFVLFLLVLAFLVSLCLLSISHVNGNLHRWKSVRILVLVPGIGLRTMLVALLLLIPSRF
jgi:hypothetical protein